MSLGNGNSQIIRGRRGREIQSMLGASQPKSKRVFVVIVVVVYLPKQYSSIMGCFPDGDSQKRPKAPLGSHHRLSCVQAIYIFFRQQIPWSNCRSLSFQIKVSQQISTINIQGQKILVMGAVLALQSVQQHLWYQMPVPKHLLPLRQPKMSLDIFQCSQGAESRLYEMFQFRK